MTAGRLLSLFLLTLVLLASCGGDASREEIPRKEFEAAIAQYLADRSFEMEPSKMQQIVVSGEGAVAILETASGRLRPRRRRDLGVSFGKAGRQVARRQPRRTINSKSETRNSKQIRSSKSECSKRRSIATKSLQGLGFRKFGFRICFRLRCATPRQVGFRDSCFGFCRVAARGRARRRGSWRPRVCGRRAERRRRPDRPRPGRARVLRNC